VRNVGGTKQQDDADHVVAIVPGWREVAVGFARPD
jgi:hypothetical protein